MCTRNCTRTIYNKTYNAQFNTDFKIYKLIYKLLVRPTKSRSYVITRARRLMILKTFKNDLKKDANMT
jgi:hypothetical protein